MAIRAERFTIESGDPVRHTLRCTVKPEFARSFNRETEQMTLKPISPNYRFGLDEIKIPVEKQDTMHAHADNSIQCMRSREKPNLDVETGAKAQVAISLAVHSYRAGKVLNRDGKGWKVTGQPPKP